MRHGVIDFLHFRCGEVPPFPDWQVVQCHVHNPDAFELRHIVAQVLAHPADLAVEALRENDSEYKRSFFPYEALFGNNP